MTEQMRNASSHTQPRCGGERCTAEHERVWMHVMHCSIGNPLCSLTWQDALKSVNSLSHAARRSRRHERVCAQRHRACIACIECLSMRASVCAAFAPAHVTAVHRCKCKYLLACLEYPQVTSKSLTLARNCARISTLSVLVSLVRHKRLRFWAMKASKTCALVVTYITMSQLVTTKVICDALRIARQCMHRALQPPPRHATLQSPCHLRPSGPWMCQQPIIWLLIQNGMIGAWTGVTSRDCMPCKHAPRRSVRHGVRGSKLVNRFALARTAACQP